MELRTHTTIHEPQASMDQRSREFGTKRSEARSAPLDAEVLGPEIVGNADGVQHAPPVLEQRQGRAARAQGVALLQHGGSHAESAQRDRRGQPRDARADDDNVLLRPRRCRGGHVAVASASRASGRGAVPVAELRGRGGGGQCHGDGDGNGNGNSNGRSLFLDRNWGWRTGAI